MFDRDEYDKLMEEARRRIKTFRERYGLNQREFSEIFHWPTSELSGIENGNRKWSLKRIVTIAKHFGVSPLLFLPSLAKELKNITSDELFEILDDTQKLTDKINDEPQQK